MTRERNGRRSAHKGSTPASNQIIDGPQSLQTLETRLDVRFSDPSLLRRALTHSSALDLASKGATNQRLEFMGDRVLGLVIAEALHVRHPQADEGELA